MNLRQRVGVTLGAVGLAVAATAVPGTSAWAAHSDSFTVSTGASPKCASYGWASYIDSYEGNDDYAGVYDGCKDDIGVEAWVWINDTQSIVHARNGGGFNTEVYFDVPNVHPGDKVTVKVCAQDGPTGGAFACGEGYTHSVDG
jgi:hypothetical protein